jgi:peptide/nickel transport system substrate-binding protein
MDRLRGSRLLLVVAGALVAVLVLAGGAAAAHQPKPVAGGTLAVGVDFELPCVNPYLNSCFFGPTRLASAPTLAGAYRQRPDFTHEPVLVDRATVGKSPFTLTYRIERDAVWNDGTAVTADDFVFTLETLLDPANDIFDRSGYDRIVEATAVDSKRVRFVFDSPYPAWKTLFPYVLPKHALEGHDFDTVWTNGIFDPETGEPIGSGPFVFTAWNRNDRMTLTRNPSWWGRDSALLDSIEIRFVGFGQTALAQALANGVVDVVELQSGPLLAGVPGIQGETVPGPAFEHVDLNVASETMPLLHERWFREAVAYALDRESLAAEAGSTFFDSPGMPVLDNLAYRGQQPEHRRHFARYDYDPERTARIMRRHGCVLGADQIWSCEGTRASLRLTTVTGNALRSFIQSHMQATAREAGIELVIENVFAGTFFGQRLPDGDFDLAIFTWSTDFGDPLGLTARYACGGSNNFMRYCSERVTDLLEASDEELSADRRRSLVNRADERMADDIPSLPLFQRPVFLYSDENVRGLAETPAAVGPTWNAEEWWIAEE